MNFETANEELYKSAAKITDTGLLHGKMGICIYFYLLGKHTGVNTCTKQADNLLDEVVNNIKKNTAISFEHGLTGIGSGIEFLSQNRFIEANTDITLNGIDVALLKHLHSEPKFELNLFDGLLGFLTYVIQRLKANNGKKSKCKELNAELLVLLISKIDFMINSSDFRTNSDVSFDCFSDLPVLFFLLANAYDLNIYNSKIERFIEQFIPVLKTNLPNLACNKLNLACGLMQVFDKTGNKKILNCVDLLLYSTNFDDICNEIEDENYHVRYGKIGLRLVVEKINCFIRTTNIYSDNELLNKLNTSFLVPEFNPEMFSKIWNFGISEGRAGILLYELLKNKSIEHL
jgi:hypothetical protein